MILELQSQLNLTSDELPSAAQLSVLFKVECPEAVQPHQHQQYPERPVPPARVPHQRWQLDGKEKVPVSDHDVATILNIRDPAAALMIASQAIIPTTDKAWRKATLSEVPETFRAAFVEWGCPLEIQTDHEVGYTGAPGVDFPSGVTVWVVGLKMVPVTSRNHRPTAQAQVERNHRTLGDMAWKDEHFLDRETLHHALTARRTRYNTA